MLFHTCIRFRHAWLSVHCSCVSPRGQAQSSAKFLVARRSAEREKENSEVSFQLLQPSKEVS